MNISKCDIIYTTPDIIELIMHYNTMNDNQVVVCRISETMIALRQGTYDQAVRTYIRERQLCDSFQR